MGSAPTVPWLNALYPDEVDALESSLGFDLDEATEEAIRRPATDGRYLRALFRRVREQYIFGLIPVPEVLREEDRVVYHEIDVVLNETIFVTIRKRHAETGQAFEPRILLESCPDNAGHSSGEMFYRLLEDVADSYSSLMDGLMDEIDELEEVIGKAPTDRIHQRYSDLRKDLLNARKQLIPLVHAVNAIEDERLDIDDRIFPDEIEGLISRVKNELHRVMDMIGLVADLLSGVRDYHQSFIAQRQNEKMEKLTIIASLLLVPTLIAGIYGQNFDRIPELHWSFGYAWSWILIGLTTVLQLLLFWRAGWLGHKRSMTHESKDIGSVLHEGEAPQSHHN